jgi:hypothetical protein
VVKAFARSAHDTGVFLVFSNGVGVDDDEIRTGVLSL